MRLHKIDKENIIKENEYIHVLIFITLIIGIIVRFIKAYTLPIVTDEAYTFWYYAENHGVCP